MYEQTYATFAPPVNPIKELRLDILHRIGYSRGLRGADFRSAPVIRGRVLVGTDRDILMAGYRRGRAGRPLVD